MKPMLAMMQRFLLPSILTLYAISHDVFGARTLERVGDAQITVDYGDSVTLQCRIKGGGEETITWTKMMNPAVIATGPSLKLTNVTRLVFYWCKATIDNKIQKTHFTIRVNYGRAIITTAAQVHIYYLVCVAYGNPPPEVAWERQQNSKWVTLTDGDDYRLEGSTKEDQSQLWAELKNPVASDAGLYRCMAKNKLGEDRKSVDMKLIPRIPLISRGSEEVVNVTAGGSTELKCGAHGWPRPITISWEFKGQTIKEGMELKLENVSMDDQGQYTCKATNSAGTSPGLTFQVNVNSPPGHKGK